MASRVRRSPSLSASLPAPHWLIARPDLVWSGPEVPGLHARDTRRVYEELVAAAERIPLDQHLRLLRRAAGVQEPRGGSTQTSPSCRSDSCSTYSGGQRRPLTQSDLVRRFAERLWHHDWPGDRSPAVFYDPRSLEPHGPGGVLHAKAVVADDEAAFVTSANLTEAAFDRNIEVGVLTRDHALAASLSTHFRALIERELLVPLPTA